MNNRSKNKGFSLVELIVVIAVMAVLVGVLAPAYLRYVDKSRLQKDMSAIAEVQRAIQVCAADPDVAAEIELPGAVGAALLERGYGGATHAKVVIARGNGAISAKKLALEKKFTNSDPITIALTIIDLIRNEGSFSDMYEGAPVLQNEVIETVGESISFETEDLKKMDIVFTVTRDENYNVQVTVNSGAFGNYPEIKEGLESLGTTPDGLTTNDDNKCPGHNWNSEYKCTVCGMTCTHSNWSNAKCTLCGKPCPGHTYSDGKCTTCSTECEHELNATGACTKNCGYQCPHSKWWDGECLGCDLVCDPHSFSNGTCETCKFVCEHKYTITGIPAWSFSGVCRICGVSRN